MAGTGAHRLTVRCRLGTAATVDRVRVRRDRARDAWLAEQLTVTAIAAVTMPFLMITDD